MFLSGKVISSKIIGHMLVIVSSQCEYSLQRITTLTVRIVDVVYALQSRVHLKGTRGHEQRKAIFVGARAESIRVTTIVK